MTRTTVPFGEFVELQPSVVLQKGERYPFIAMADVEPNVRDVRPGGRRTWKGSGNARFMNGDVIFARITPCLEHGKTARIVGLARGGGFGSTEFFVFRARPGISESAYVYYLARSPQIREPAIKSMIGASGRQRAQRTVIERISVSQPPLSEQRSIASILSAYDDLIENNRRRIELLERAARLLYREWFVHLRFPGHEQATIVDEIPEGWVRYRIKDVCDTVGGGTPSTKVHEYWNGDITWVVPSDVTKNDSLVLLDSGRKITVRGLRKSSAKMVPANTILMTSRASVGFFAVATSEVCTNQGFINIIAHENHNRMYMLFNLMSRVDEIRNNAKGTTYPEISKGRFREMHVVLPPRELAIRFSGIVGGIVSQICCLARLNRKLTQARDLLLPRLMNGEISV